MTQDIGLDEGPKALRTKEELDAQFPLQVRDLCCPDCGADLVLKDGKYGIFYGCVKWSETGCKGGHNCHKQTAVPLGTPANAETRTWRRKAHEAFDAIWQKEGLKSMSRDAAYKWLANNLNLSTEDAHIAKLDIAGCQKVIKAVERWQNPPNRFDFIDGYRAPKRTK